MTPKSFFNQLINFKKVFFIQLKFFFQTLAQCASRDKIPVRRISRLNRVPSSEWLSCGTFTTRLIGQSRRQSLHAPPLRPPHSTTGSHVAQLHCVYYRISAQRTPVFPPLHLSTPNLYIFIHIYQKYNLSVVFFFFIFHKRRKITQKSSTCPRERYVDKPSTACGYTFALTDQSWNQEDLSRARGGFFFLIQIFFCRTFPQCEGFDWNMVRVRIFLSARWVFLFDAGVNRGSVLCLGQRFSLCGQQSGSSMPVQPQQPCCNANLTSPLFSRRRDGKTASYERARAPTAFKRARKNTSGALLSSSVAFRLEGRLGEQF